MTKRRVIGTRQTAEATGAVGTLSNLMAYVKQVVTEGIARDAAIAVVKADIAAMLAIQSQQCCVKTDGAVLTGLDPLFTISGGPIRARVVGLVTTLLVGNSNLRLQHITTAPAATVELNAGAVAVNDNAVGTMYYNVGATSVFTPTGGLGFHLADPVTVDETYFLLAPGVVQCLGSAARVGVIAWYMTYEKLSSLSAVVAAA